MTLYITSFVVILFFSIWLTSEYHSRQTLKRTLRYSRIISEQERELGDLRSQIAHTQENKMNTQVVMAEKKVREVERQYNRLAGKYKRLNECVLTIQDKLANDDYKGNQLARYVLEQLKTVGTAVDEGDKAQLENAKAAFARIKGKLEGDSAA